LWRCGGGTRWAVRRRGSPAAEVAPGAIVTDPAVPVGVGDQVSPVQVGELARHEVVVALHVALLGWFRV
jgi:hypothetical protein